MTTTEPVFTRAGSFVVFNQLGVKLELDPAVDKRSWYNWLDGMTRDIGRLVPGAEIAEKAGARGKPRLNTGVYYDTADRRLLRLGAVLRTTCSKETHAFCAFKQPADDRGVRRDHRHIFEGEPKATIQRAPTSPESVAIVKALLTRTDIEHPGVHLRRCYAITGEDLSPSLCIEQLRHGFYVWLDGRDALRCLMDHAEVFDLRSHGERRVFREVELPIFPRIEPDVARDPRVPELIHVLADSLRERFGVTFTTLNKYQRAAATLGIAS
jgi:hypothetical protein